MILRCSHILTTPSNRSRNILGVLLSFVHCAAMFYLGAARPHCSCLCARLSSSWLLRPELAASAQDLLQGELQSAVQTRRDLQREYCAQCAEERRGSASKLQRSAVQRRAPRSFRAAALLSARMQQPSRVAVIVSLVLLQAIAAESCPCCSALTSACVR